MSEIEVKQNEQNGGYCANFYKGKKKFFADLCSLPFVESECMIFERDKRGNIDWRGVYCKRDLPVTEQSLLDCINEFLEIKQ